MATNQPQEDFQKTALRLPKALHAQLHKAAAENGRTYNSEIIQRLQSTFGVTADAMSSGVGQGVAELTEMVVPMSTETKARIEEMAKLSGRSVDEEIWAIISTPPTEREIEAIQMLLQIQREQERIGSILENVTIIGKADDEVVSPKILPSKQPIKSPQGKK